MVAAPWMGATRFMWELAERLCAGGGQLVHLRGGGRLADRLAAGLTAADLRPDPVKAAALGAFVAPVGDLDGQDDDAVNIGRALAHGDGLLIGTHTEIPTGAGFVELGPLDEESADDLLAAVAPRLDDATANRILDLATGRPGVIVELGRANRSPLSDADTLRLPPSLRRGLADRVAAADSSDAQDVARWMAAFGDAMGPGELVRLTGRTEAGLAPVTDALVAAGLVARVHSPGPIAFALTDPLLGEVIRQATPESELRRRHAAILHLRRSQGHAPDALVSHAIGMSDQHQVVDLSIRAAAGARDRGDARAALAHAERAVRWSEQRYGEEGRLDALTEHGLAQASAGEWDEAAVTLSSVIRRQRRAGREAAALRALTGWARIRFLAGDRAEAAELIAQNISTDGPSLAERAEVFIVASLMAAFDGHHSIAREWACQARDEALACGEVPHLIRALNGIGLAEVFGSASPDGIANFREALKLARDGGFNRQAALTLNNEAVSLLMLGMVRRAADRAQEGLDLVESTGVGELAAPLSNNLAEAEAAMGRLRNARRAAERSRLAYREMGVSEGGSITALAAWIDVAEGKLVQGLDALRAVSQELDEDMDLETKVVIAALHAQAAKIAGEDAEAEQIVRSYLAQWHGTEDRLDGLPLLGAALEILPAREAKPYLAEVRTSAAAGSPLAAALVPFGEAFAARQAARSALLREASARFAATDHNWWAARCLLLAGEAGQKDSAAVEDLLEARRMFREMEAPGWRARCEAALRARGHRFVMASRHRDDSGLSERELEVLDHVAQGLTNKDIADRLFISEKTVGRHLERVYGKLGVNSRTAAVNAAIDKGLITEVV